jgi:hypothetical protein
MEKCDVAQGDVTCSLNFQNYFSIEKGDVACSYFLEFLELFFNRERWRACYLNFQNYFSMEKGDMALGDFLEFFELFFNKERWCHEMMLHTCKLRELKLLSIHFLEFIDNKKIRVMW